MDKPKDGGPAFPSTDAKGFTSDGMSLRDYFAGQALAGLIACPNTSGHEKDFARDAYMLAERQKECA